MKVLVTGGAGFIGSHIVDLLLEKDYTVVVVDNLVTGKQSNLNPKAKFYNVDICSASLEYVFSTEKPDFVIHQAAQVDVALAIKDPVHDAEVNIIGSLKLLELCRKYNVKKFVYGNSGGAPVGEPQYLPVDEKHPRNPLAHYGVSKHVVQYYLDVYAHLYNLDYVTLGYANVYGPRQDPFGEGGVIAIFTYKLLQDQQPVIFGDGEQTRDFVFVKDVARANILALSLGKNVFCNVATAKEVTVNALVTAMNAVVGKSVEAKHIEARKGDIVRSVLSNDRIKEVLGWEPQTDLQDGLRETMEALKNETRTSN